MIYNLDNNGGWQEYDVVPKELTVQSVTANPVAAVTLGKDVTLTGKASGGQGTKSYEYQISGADSTVVVADATGKATFEGLKAGTYYLEEVAAPTGYNLLADPIKVVISATGVSAYANQEAAVANNTGVELPSTGGMGTTIFYTVGGILMAGAAILLITKKKMANEQ